MVFTPPQFHIGIEDMGHVAIVFTGHGRASR